MMESRQTLGQESADLCCEASLIGHSISMAVMEHQVRYNHSLKVGSILLLVEADLFMRIAYLAAGAGGMYCGSCLRDNRLAATLIDQGKDVVLLPLYTPLRTDEHNVSEDKILFGGINVYLQQQSSLLRWLAKPFGRWLDSRLLLKTIAKLAGGSDPKDLGALTVSVLRASQGPMHSQVEKLMDSLRSIRPDVVVLPNLMFAGFARPMREAMNTTILCTLSGEDLFLDQLREPDQTEAFQLVKEGSQSIDGFLATSNYYADHAADHFSIPRDRVHYVPMGVRVDDFRLASRSKDVPFTIGYLARIAPEKGLANLVEAFIHLRSEGRDCRLRVAGYLGAKDRSYLEGLQSKLRKAGIEPHFDYVGEVDFPGKVEFLSGLHIFSVPTHYREAKGLYLLEALACGVPVVQPRHGSFPELLEATGGGLLYDPSDADGLARNLAKLMDDRELLAQLGQQGCEAVRESFNDGVMADSFWSVCERVVSEHKGN